MHTIDVQESLQVAGNDGRFLQSVFWQKFKSCHGWQGKHFSLSVDSATPVPLSVLVRTFGKGFFSLAYVPMGPERSAQMITDNDGVEQYCQLLSHLTLKLKPYLPHNTLCVRYDPPIDFFTCDERDAYIAAIKNKSKNRHLHVIKNKVNIQPPDTVFLDLSKDADTLLSEMKPKWRYNIRLSEKKGVTVTAIHAGDSGFAEAIDDFYKLYETTASRDGIAIHEKTYYQQLLELSSNLKSKDPSTPKITLYIARHEGDCLAAIITLFSLKEAVYLYGASSNIKRNLMPAYLLQWHAINDAKNYGSAQYDFYGIPPAEDKHHPMYGLYRFKTGFGGTIIHRPGSLDCPVSHLYRPYTVAEDIRAFWHKKVKKLIAGR